jgi:predicted nucleic acid-binding protein
LNRYLLDTNVVSELRKPRPHGAVVSWISGLQEEQIYLSAVTIGEVQTGVELTRRQDPLKAAEIELWVDQLAQSFQVLPMDARCFREYARLMEGKAERLLEDVMIAATARIHNLIVATRNEKDFKQLGVKVLDPFKTAR